MSQSENKKVKLGLSSPVLIYTIFLFVKINPHFPTFHIQLFQKENHKLSTSQNQPYTQTSLLIQTHSLFSLPSRIQNTKITHQTLHLVGTFTTYTLQSTPTNHSSLSNLKSKQMTLKATGHKVEQSTDA
jgi:hypothetical protein